ncbi:M36 family metallopeptidase [Conexibacter woesei]|uniref:Peptidase M36 fungalysin n=1 Tax=Conexibacter woesei (strain DSM 14684 / CCUG 47730 / CIP 108061 / JCM 11494 / NBRC 100937 / ID131577) TaxID=469383 RepID=D3F857_CONWI|nr:M36 family metallopeptidase [Conexibacter woesei]ADB48927.1 peptidase M36 fungalysin [Conexibacter woesei DSM 14684]
MAVAAPVQATQAPPDEELPNVDRRVDRASGGVSDVGRPDRQLTAPSSRPPQEIVLGYVRAHPAVFGLDEPDIANLRLVARSVSPDGIVHLRFNQVLDGIWSFDSGIDGHVTADGRLITVSGAPVPGARLPAADPALGARAGLREAREAVGGPASLPATTDVDATPEQATTFAGGERAILRWSATADGPRLAWSVLAGDGGDRLYDVLVDAERGTLLRRQSLTAHVGQARYFAADPLRTPIQTQLTMPLAWYDDHDGGMRLWGQYARTYVDREDEDPAPGAELGGSRVQIPASSGAPAAPDWLYAQSTAFPDPLGVCPASGCTWNRTDQDSPAVNQFQAATNAHVLASRFHDHLLQAPIGFDEASGNFQRTNSSGSGAGDDYVRVEVNDGEGYNNANFSTPPDGIAPRMQMFLYTRRNVNGSDTADIVYHEYAHGLSNRLVVNASGSSTLTSIQADMMGEAWSDFYALDLLVHEGHMTDTAAPGELTKGSYTSGPGGSRTKPIDCPVDPAGRTATCNGAPLRATVLGGYTYGDLAVTNNESPHNGGEVWAQTLWEIRTALGRQTALALITGGMRLSVDNPSMLDMRDAILQQAVATRSAPGAADDHYERLWAIFRNRGMGADASTRSTSSTTPAEGFGVVAAAGPATFTDPYPDGDNDGVVEPGERFEISQALRSVIAGDVGAVSGRLTSRGSATVEDATAAWPLLGGGRQAVNGDPLAVRLAPGCTRAAPLTLALSSTHGPAKADIVVDPRPGSSETVTLADATGSGPGVTTTSFEVAGSGTVTDVDLRIDELRHDRIEDLTIELVHGGASAVVLDRVLWWGDDIIDAIFDSDSPALLVAMKPGPISGRVQPPVRYVLNAFDGLPVAGTWTLRIHDAGTGERGVLHRWGLDSPQQSCRGRLEIPEVRSDAADGIEQHAATLSGAVTPNGRETGLRFAFGTTAAYGATSPVTSAGAGDAPISASFRLTGLKPGTTYHYRVETLREGGQVAVASADRTFTTTPTPGPRVDPPPIVPPRVGPPPIDPRPQISNARVTLARAGRRTDRRRASFSFTVSEPAKVTAVVTRAAPGIRKGKRCVAVPRRRPRGAKPCTRQLPAASGTVALRSARRGTLQLPAAGLGKGRYTATLTAVDATGNASTPVVVRFTVK